MKIKNPTKKPKSNFLKSILLIITIALSLRIFVFEIYLVPSPSMEKTILPGEFILINKLAYGARLLVDPVTGKETRAPGYSNIKHNDVVVFNYPQNDTIYKNRPEVDFHESIGWQGYEKALSDTIENGSLMYLPVKYRQPFVKRCIGMPGDTLRFLKNAVFVNQQCAKDPTGSWQQAVDSLNAGAFSFMENKYRPTLRDTISYHYFFPHYLKENWSFDSYGPLYIPKKGDTIHLTYDNFSIYDRIIITYERNQLDTLAGNIYINKQQTNSYIIKQNYYYMMGDNYWNSKDSRFWGFVPENHIIGKAVAIVWSRDENRNGWFKVRGDRLFRSLY